jgi:hypothetical protein
MVAKWRVMTMIDDIDAHSDAGVRSVDADESGRADYARRLILARRPEITDADLAALADPPAELLMAEIGEEIADVLAALAEKERRLISQRTKDALAVRKAQGVKLGGLNAKGVQNREEAKARAEGLRPLLMELSSLSARAIAAELNARGIATPSGGRWHAETVIRVQRRLEDLS